LGNRAKAAAVNIRHAVMIFKAAVENHVIYVLADGIILIITIDAEYLSLKRIKK
jgi:hypothetical protein